MFLFVVTCLAATIARAQQDSSLERPLTRLLENPDSKSINIPYGTKLTASDIDRLSQRTKLVELEMGFPQIDSEYVTIEGDLQKLGRLRHLEVLRLCKDGIKDDDLKFIASLPRIRILEINADNGYEGAPICTDRCADYLSRAKTLRTLMIYDGRFTDKFVDKLTRGLPDLEVLWLTSSAALTDESLRMIGDRCKNLRELRVASAQFTAKGRQHLDNLKKLEERSVTSRGLRTK
jgi:hypothetical protein